MVSGSNSQDSKASKAQAVPKSCLNTKRLPELQRQIAHCPISFVGEGANTQTNKPNPRDHIESYSPFPPDPPAHTHARSILTSSTFPPVLTQQRGPSQGVPKNQESKGKQPKPTSLDERQAKQRARKEARIRMAARRVAGLWEGETWVPRWEPALDGNGCSEVFGAREYRS